MHLHNSTHIKSAAADDDEKRSANPARKLQLYICMYVCMYVNTLLYTLNALIPKAITYPPTHTSRGRRQLRLAAINSAEIETPSRFLAPAIKSQS